MGLSCLRESERPWYSRYSSSHHSVSLLSLCEHLQLSISGPCTGVLCRSWWSSPGSPCLLTSGVVGGAWSVMKHLGNMTHFCPCLQRSGREVHSAHCSLYVQSTWNTLVRERKPFKIGSFPTVDWRWIPLLLGIWTWRWHIGALERECFPWCWNAPRSTSFAHLL